MSCLQVVAHPHAMRIARQLISGYNRPGRSRVAKKGLQRRRPRRSEIVADGLSNAEVSQVYRTYGHLILRRCRVVLRDDALADDALQEVFVKVMRYGTELRTVEKKLRWLYRVSDRVCFDLIAKRKRQPDPREIPDLPTPPPGPPIEARDAVLRFLDRLKGKDLQIAVLAWVDGMSQGEIADETGWSRQTINKKMKRIRDRAEVFRRRHVG